MDPQHNFCSGGHGSAFKVEQLLTKNIHEVISTKPGERLLNCAIIRIPLILQIQEIVQE
jgi:hypothetical protein